jgi:hypothetical protein
METTALDMEWPIERTLNANTGGLADRTSGMRRSGISISATLSAGKPSSAGDKRFAGRFPIVLPTSTATLQPARQRAAICWGTKIPEMGFA